MASTSSLGNASLANASSAHTFYTHFRAATWSLLEQLSSVPTPEVVQDALQKYAALSAELTRAVDSGVLPAHDQAVHKTRLDEVAAALDESRKAVQTQEAGKSKRGFAFKRKQQQPIAPRPSLAAPTPSGAAASNTTDAPNLPLAQPSQKGEGEGSGVIATSSSSSHVAISGLQRETYIHNSLDALDTPISLDLLAISSSLIDLRHCVTTVKSVQLRNVAHSIVFLPPVEGSIMIHDLTSSVLVVPSCHQFRMHTSEHVMVELCTKRGSVVTIEACKRVVFVQQPDAQMRVQDFDDLIHSEQLKHRASADQHADQKANFIVVNRKAYSLEQRCHELASSASSASSIEASISNLLEELESTV